MQTEKSAVAQKKYKTKSQEDKKKDWFNRIKNYLLIKKQNGTKFN